jgi:hypothetical protein
MNRPSEWLRCAAVGLGAVALVSAGTLPAAADDARMVINSAGQTRAVATWDDLTDNLCVRMSAAGTAVAKIAPISGPGREVVIRDRRDGGSNCTGNLSIAEDRLYSLTLEWYRDGAPIAYNGTRFYT